MPGGRGSNYKKIYPELTSIDHIWSLLYATGYLTQRGQVKGRQVPLAIPNQEIRDIFETQIMEFFQENVRGDGETLSRFCDALQSGSQEDVEKVLAAIGKKIFIMEY